LLRQTGVGPAGEDHQVLLRGALDAGHAWPPSAPEPVCRESAPSVPVAPVPSPAARAASAASAVRVPARLRATQPSTLRCRARETAICPGSTSPVSADPAPV